ncbi:MAG: Uma2 family endonuclease, partial [Planctomycetes bacterium]|nr:Uma2 family endonuclease [Planctomycetota bacterium]
MTALSTSILTADDFFMKEDLQSPVELVRGQVIEMPPPTPHHGLVCLNIAYLLKQHVDSHQLGHVFTNDSCIVTERDPDTVRGVNVGYISYAKVPKGTFPKGQLTHVPELVVDVRSASDRWKDILKNVVEYLEAGVSVVCVLDPTTETGRVYRSDKEEEQFRNGDFMTF